MIRMATKADLEGILHIYNDAIKNTTAVYTYDETTLAEREQWFENKLEKNQPVIVFDVDGDVAGFATYGSFRDWAAYQYTIEHSIYVNSNYRRQGIASKLLIEIIDMAKKNGFKTIVAGIDGENKDSIALHKKLGFKYNGTIEKVGYKFDRWLDLEFYQLMLK
ncbi:GNAT family N-acetyltransferase [Mammaliicoccus sp. Dog046]|uniref:GNAT family N-acetyltransferase n=1 Tax=Mammaliicoccus sp. Dog046 TaxID=3034233 RepID=UPI002B25B61E|nr:GNAT family N-acetyltransferase [Mammaliicoccus sp. Dog046]WQK84958.1 N-acetyltransferase family protein [Mammaliicoccus sp. Dog046]